MKKFLFLAVAALVAAPTGAQAQGGLPTKCGGISTTATAPLAWIIVNDQCTDVSQYLNAVQQGKIWSLDTPVLDLFGGRVQLSARYNADPFITFGITTTNLTAGPTTYAFLFGTPVVPGIYSVATSTGGVSVTNGARGSGSVSTSSVHPTYISGYGTVGFFPTNLGVDIGTAPCTATGVPFTVTTVCNQGSASNTFGPTFYDNLEALVTYEQNDLASVASWSGAITLNAATVVPEPSTLALMAGGLALLVGFTARRRRNSST
ncbi:MAG: PEP-CTERM sorting domain-containing protein [Phycisphaerae bacterium]|nr:PEP-CTERM sorting domain-containing protein [Gemmatimonadaceae bacterium]